MGWMTDTYRGHRRVHHGGGIDGFTANTCLFPDDGMGLVVLTNKDGTPLPELITRHAADRLLSLEPIDWLAEGLDKRNKGLDAQKEAKKKKESVRRPGTRPAHPLEEYAGDYEHPGYGPLTVELRDGKLVATYNGIAATLDHWHYEVFNAPKADNDPALADLNWKIQFQTNVKGYVDAVAVPLEPSVKPIVFTRRPDRKLSDPEYLKRFEGEYELAGQACDRPAPGPRPDPQADRRAADRAGPRSPRRVRPEEAARRERPLRQRPRGPGDRDGRQHRRRRLHGQAEAVRSDPPPGRRSPAGRDPGRCRPDLDGPSATC